jgi:hypothetical protein
MLRGGLSATRRFFFHQRPASKFFALRRAEIAREAFKNK